MKVSLNSGSISYGATGTYVIFHDEGVETGLFFRFPIRKVCYKVFTEQKNDPSLIEFVQDCKDSRLFRIFNYIMGNKNAVKEILEENIFNDDDLYGIDINKFISPIYFKRNYRKLDIINMDEDQPVNYISSYGYDDEYNQVAGNCTKETTYIHTKYKKREIKLRRGKKYLYTYIHTAKELIKLLEARSFRENNK